MCGGVIYESNYEPYGPGSGESGSEEYRYTGKQEDPTGLYYFGARYYDPVTGRFTTRDIIFGNLVDPQSLNRYSYCRNNPHKYIDPDGRSETLAEVLAVLGWAEYQGFLEMYWYLNEYPGDMVGAHTRYKLGYWKGLASGSVSFALVRLGVDLFTANLVGDLLGECIKLKKEQDYYDLGYSGIIQDLQIIVLIKC
ncbi:RHS repeat-associated core domain-containing protein [Candidatus Bathyarchaeota archaeon]|nr:RHS repeat-associated core domain-containing protein [Candidatus Bathyarchaeota archaeon]